MARPLDERGRADDHAANRRAKTFAEAERHRVEAGAIVLETARARGDDFPEASAIAVDVDGWGLGAGPGGDLAADGQGLDGACEGVFEAD